MENIIFYGLVLLCIALLFVIGYNYSRINRLEKKNKDDYQCYEDTIQDYKRRTENTKSENKNLNDQIEVYKAAIVERDEVIHQLKLDNASQTSLNLNQLNIIIKQSDKITILKEQVESLTNHLQEKAKPFDAMEELDNLITRKDVFVSEIIKQEDWNNAKRMTIVFEALNELEESGLMPRKECLKSVITAINGELKTKKQPLVDDATELKNECVKKLREKQSEELDNLTIREDRTKLTKENLMQDYFDYKAYNEKQSEELKEALNEFLDNECKSQIGVSSESVKGCGIKEIAETFKKPKKATKKK
jgi:hypothetical protein